MFGIAQGCVAHLVSITPEVVLGADVLVWVLGSLLQRLHVLPMRPMLVPQVVRIDAGDYQSWNRHAIEVSSASSAFLIRFRVPDSAPPHVLDRQLAPKVYFSRQLHISSFVIGRSLTRSSCSMVLYSLSLTVESVILGTGERRAFSTRESSLERCPHSR